MTGSDEALIENFLAWDARSFEMLIERHMQGIFSICMRICQDENDAHDITQNACLKIMENLHGFKRNAAFRTWAYRIAYTESLQFLRSKKEYVDLETVEPYLWECDAIDFDKADTEKLVRECVDRLSKTDRTIVLLFYYDELKIREIAEIMDMNENTVKTRLSRAKSLLQAHLEPLWKTSSKRTIASRK